jgi:hypothetical protein
MVVIRHEVVLGEVAIRGLSGAISSHIEIQGTVEMARKARERQVRCRPNTVDRARCIDFTTALTRYTNRL